MLLIDRFGTGRDSVQDVSEEREVRVIECRERVELLVMLAKSLQVAMLAK